MGSFFEVFMLLMLLLVFVFILAVVAFILTAIPLHRMAKNAGIPNPWLSFIPVAQRYILGAVGQRSLYGRTGRHQPLAMVNLICGIVGTLNYVGTNQQINGYYYGSATVINGILTAAWIASLVVYCYTLYQILADYNPTHKVILLVVCILTGGIGTIVVLFVHQNTVPQSVTGPGYPTQPKYSQAPPPPPPGYAYGPGPQGPPPGYGAPPPYGYTYGPGQQGPPPGYGAPPPHGYTYEPGQQGPPPGYGGPNPAGGEYGPQPQNPQQPPEAGGDEP